MNSIVNITFLDKDNKHTQEVNAHKMRGFILQRKAYFDETSKDCGDPRDNADPRSGILLPIGRAVD